MSETGVSRTLGEVAYEAYRKHADGKSLITGLGIPHWGALSAEVQAGWEAAGAAVREHVVSPVLVKE